MSHIVFNHIPLLCGAKLVQKQVSLMRLVRLVQKLPGSELVLDPHQVGRPHVALQGDGGLSMGRSVWPKFEKVKPAIGDGVNLPARDIALPLCYYC